MTVAAMKIERSGPAIRAVLAECAADEGATFEAALRQAIERAAESFDLAPAEAVLDQWWGIAVIRANPLSEHEQARLPVSMSLTSVGCWLPTSAGTGFGCRCRATAPVWLEIARG